MPSEARVKPREGMDRTSNGRNCSGQLGLKIKDVLLWLRVSHDSD